MPKGIAFGPYNPPAGGPFTGGFVGVTPGSIVSDIAAARRAKRRLIITTHGGSHDRFKTGGKFDLAKWAAWLERYDTAPIRRAVEDGVDDFSVLGDSAMDEPFNTSPDNSWGPKGTMTKARVDRMAAMIKAVFPTLPVGVVHDHDDFEPDKSYRVIDFILSQYRASKGPVAKFRDAGLRLARRDHHAIAFSLNVLDGGSKLSGCPKPQTGGAGTYGGNCRMTPAQVWEFGQVLGVAGGALTMWRFDARMFNDVAYQLKFGDLATLLAKQKFTALRRGLAG